MIYVNVYHLIPTTVLPEPSIMENFELLQEPLNVWLPSSQPSKKKTSAHPEYLYKNILLTFMNNLIKYAM